MTREEENSIKKDYLNGMHYKDIFNKYNITLSELKKIIYKYNLSRSKSQVLKNNQNAKNSKGGGAIANKNAVTTGEYESIYADVLTEEEKQLYNNYEINDKEDSLLEQYISEYKLLTIREIRMLNRIRKLEEAEKDMTVKNIKKKKNSEYSETTTEVESTIDKIQRIEDGITRITEAKRKSRENMIKLGFSRRELILKEKRAADEIW